MSCTISVVVCTYTRRRWDALRECVSALQSQTLPPHQVIVVVDHEPALLDRVGTELADAIAISNDGPPGEAGSRNAGVRGATGSIVAFIDDDAVAEPDWLERIAEAYEDEQTIAVGGAILPKWSQSRPSWFPPEFDWVVGCTYQGMPDARTEVRNLIGANMSFRSEVFEQLEFFPGLGHARGRSLGGTETDFCIRLAEALPARRIVYEPRARVHHRVPPERARFSYFLSRCFNEGLSKGVLSGRVGSRTGLASERTYVREILPAAARRTLRGVEGTRRPEGAARVLAMVAGVGAAGSGYAFSRVRRLTSVSDRATSG